MADQGKLTDRQIALIYFRPEQGPKPFQEPDTEDEIRASCLAVRDNFPADFTDESFNEWVEKSIAAWRESKRGEA